MITGEYNEGSMIRRNKSRCTPARSASQIKDVEPLHNHPSPFASAHEIELPIKMTWMTIKILGKRN